MINCTGSIDTRRKQGNIISRIKETYSEWSFVRDNLYKLKKFQLIPTIYDKIGKQTFENYIKRREDYDVIEKYWDGFKLCKILQRNNLLIKRPGIINQILALSKCFKEKKFVAQVIFDYEIDEKVDEFNHFLIRWEKVLIENLNESKAYMY